MGAGARNRDRKWARLPQALLDLSGRLPMMRAPSGPFAGLPIIETLRECINVTASAVESFGALANT